METTERFCVENVPSLRPTGNFFPEKEPRGVPLRSVVIVQRHRITLLDRVFPPDRFVMKQTIDRHAAPTNIRLKKNHPARINKRTACLAQKSVGSTQMMKNIEEHKVR